MSATKPTGRDNVKSETRMQKLTDNEQATFMSITRDQYNNSLPLRAGAPVGTYHNKYKAVDKEI